jgi:integrase
MARLMLLRLKHVHRFRDRHGTVRHYLRVPGRKAVPLPGEPGSPAFLRAYHAAIDAPPPARGPAAGTLNALAVSYYASPAFTDLRATTQAHYRRLVEHLRNRHGDKPVALLDGQGVRRILAEHAGRPAAANHSLRILRLLCAHAVEAGLLRDDPTTGIKRRRYDVKGYRTWSEAEIARFEDHHPTGTVARLAFALLLYTGQRRSDVVRMGRQHISDGMIDVRQVKTGRRLKLPIHPALAAELAHIPRDQLTFLARDNGTARTSNGFYNTFTTWCTEAGLPQGLSPHGLRKAAARRLAESGATVHEIAAITGHRSLQEVAVYTEAAEQAALARRAMGRVVPITKPANRDAV